MRLFYKQLLLGELVAPEVFKWYQSRGHGFEPQECRWGGDCWQIEGLAASINSPYVRRGRLGEYTIRLGYVESW